MSTRKAIAVLRPWDVAHTCVDVVWNPSHEAGGVLALRVQHLLVHILVDMQPRHGNCGEIMTMTRTRSAHHVFGIENLLGQLKHREPGTAE